MSSRPNHNLTLFFKWEKGDIWKKKKQQNIHGVPSNSLYPKVFILNFFKTLTFESLGTFNSITLVVLLYLAVICFLVTMRTNRLDIGNYFCPPFNFIVKFGLSKSFYKFCLSLRYQNRKEFMPRHFGFKGLHQHHFIYSCYGESSLENHKSFIIYRICIG